MVDVVRSIPASAEIDLVHLCNILTEVAGVTLKVNRSEEAVAILSNTSLFVACCEALLGKKLDGIKRCPASACEREKNVQVVLWELAHTVLQTDLSHISSRGVVAGDPIDVHNLLEILSALLAAGDTAVSAEGQQSDTDHIPAVYQESVGSQPVQPDASRGLADSNVDVGDFLSPPPKSCGGHSLHARHQSDSTLIAGLAVFTAPSPASVRPKQHTAASACPHGAAADDEEHGSQCSQCMDGLPGCADDCSGAADRDEPTRPYQGSKKAAGRSGGGKRKLRVKKQVQRAPLVMSKCYATAVAPAQHKDKGQADSQASDRQGSSSEQEAEVGPGRVSLLDPSMTAKLAHLYSLNRPDTQDDPKSSQQRQRYEAARQQAEQQRVGVQRQVWLKQSLARRRIEAARQQQQLLLHSRSQAFHAKVDAIRSAQQAAEAAAAEESHRLRWLAAQEAKLKETFLEAVEAEKEKLLLAREQGLQGRPTSSSQGKAAHSRLLQTGKASEKASAELSLN